MMFGGALGEIMPDPFVAQSLVETKIAEGQRFVLTFVDAHGATQSLTLPSHVAADLVPVLTSLAAKLGDTDGREFTRLPKLWSVGRAPHERLVLIRFDDEPAYGLHPAVADDLWRELREATERVALARTPARH